MDMLVHMPVVPVREPLLFSFTRVLALRQEAKVFQASPYDARVRFAQFSFEPPINFVGRKQCVLQPVFFARLTTSHVHDFLEWIAETAEELTDEVMAKQQKEKPQWDLAWLNRQLFGILSETATGNLKEMVMQRC